MSPLRLAAQRRRACLLASTFLIPVFSLGISAASAQQTASSNPLPPIEITSPGDENRTRAKPVTDDGSGSRRVAPRVAQPANTNVAPAPDANTRKKLRASLASQMLKAIGAHSLLATISIS